MIALRKHAKFFIFPSVIITLFLIGLIFDQAITYFFYLDEGAWWGHGKVVLEIFYFPLNAILFTVFLVISSGVVLASLNERPYFLKFKAYRRHGLYFVALTLIGAGLLNGYILKSIFARPRPLLLIEEGIYVAPLMISPAYFGQSNLSFPSGHVSMSAIALACYFVFERPVWLKKWIGLYGALMLIALMTLSRVSFGDHYLSDGLFAVLFMLVFMGILKKVLRIESANLALRYITFEKHKISIGDGIILTISFLIPFILVMMLVFMSHGLTRF